MNNADVIEQLSRAQLLRLLLNAGRSARREATLSQLEGDDLAPPLEVEIEHPKAGV